jgi:putative NADH-flavin reductase
MSVPTIGQERLLIVGGTGMVGGYALRYALDNLAVRSVTSIGRKKLGISHPKLKEVLHQNFADCSALADALSGQDAVVYCLGAYTGSVSDTELRVIPALHGHCMDVPRRPINGPGTWSFLLDREETL